MSIGIAIIGGGIFAREEHLPAVRASSHLTLKAIYSRSLKSAQSLGTESSVDLYSEDSDQGKGKGYGAVLGRSDVHAVIIALPILTQPEYIKKAILAGKHVLSEKPIAKDLETAKELIEWYGKNNTIDGKQIRWSVAENFRYMESLRKGQEERAKLGKIVEFSLKRHTLVRGGKYFETAWRKVPDYQGGFLLDGGVHDVAGLRLVLSGDPVAKLSAFTRQNQPHLPPVDTIDATLKLKSGATGTLSQSFGTTFPNNSEWAIACEQGTVTVGRAGEIVHSSHTDKKLGNVVRVFGPDSKLVKEIPVEDDGSGVTPEVKDWAEALANDKSNEIQSPEQALADLELIEKMLRSGEQDGVPQSLTLQI